MDTSLRYWWAEGRESRPDNAHDVSAVDVADGIGGAGP
jgi:hypothetical protein